jgi:hypothetical protein
MKSINKTQFKLIYSMYNNNDYHKTLTKSRDIDQALSLCDLFPDIFLAKRLSHSEYIFSISLFKDVLPIIKYNQKFEATI